MVRAGVGADAAGAGLGAGLGIVRVETRWSGPGHKENMFTHSRELKRAKHTHTLNGDVAKMMNTL